MPLFSRPNFLFGLAIALSVTFWNGSCQAKANDQPRETDERPNILWLSTEDIGPELNCYGDPTAKTPALDKLARQGVVYRYAWSNYPVCAPARTTIITGMYAATCGAGNMRSSMLVPEGVDLFPYYLRQAGYYCTNNSKTDYNYRGFENEPWDESSKKAHYKNRKPGQPFFAVFNHTGTHESKIRKRPHKAVVDPASVTLKKYWPDKPEVRTDLAQYYDNLQTMDGWIKRQLKELADAGEADNTIVVFFGDHGSGMPRHKRFAGDSGMRVPFIVHVPEKWKSLVGKDFVPGKESSRMVGFIDLAPTMLSIAGIQPREHMQGHAFLGQHRKSGPRYLYGFRDRMDERPDTSRSIRNERFLYVRNFRPYLPAGQPLDYQLQTPTTRIWKELFDAGKLNDIQAKFWRLHPPEELYDLTADPEETINLAGNPEFAGVLKTFRNELRSSHVRFGDLGLIPEPTLKEIDNGKQSPRVVLDNPASFPLGKVFDAASFAASPQQSDSQRLGSLLQSANPTLRYWGLIGVLIRGEQDFGQHAERIVALVDDANPAAAIIAAELTAQYGKQEQKSAALERLLALADYRNSNVNGAIDALNAIDRLGNKAAAIQQRVQNVPQQDPQFSRGKSYIPNLLKAISRHSK